MPAFRLSPTSHWYLIVGAAFLTILSTAHLLASPLLDLLDSEAVMRVDRATWEFCRTHTSSTLLAAMSLVSAMHGTLGILVLTAIASVAWRLCGHRDACVKLLLAVPTGMLLNALVKAAIHRSRPDWAVVGLPSSASFPSGHVAEATVFYGFLALEATVVGARVALRRVLALTSVAMVALVASSRVILGVHFLSDCVGAAFEGLLWLAACMYPYSLRAHTATRGEA